MYFTKLCKLDKNARIEKGTKEQVRNFCLQIYNLIQSLNCLYLAFIESRGERGQTVPVHSESMASEKYSFSDPTACNYTNTPHLGTVSTFIPLQIWSYQNVWWPWV